MAGAVGKWPARGCVGVARATCPAAHSDSHVNGKKSPFEGVIPGAKWRKRDGKSRPSVWRDPKS